MFLVYFDTKEKESPNKIEKLKVKKSFRLVKDFSKVKSLDVLGLGVKDILQSLLLARKVSQESFIDA